MSATILTFPGARRWEPTVEQAQLLGLPVPPRGERFFCGACGREASVWARFGFRCSACARALIEADPFLFTDVFEEETT